MHQGDFLRDQPDGPAVPALNRAQGFAEKHYGPSGSIPAERERSVDRRRQTGARRTSRQNGGTFLTWWGDSARNPQRAADFADFTSPGSRCAGSGLQKSLQEQGCENLSCASRVCVCVFCSQEIKHAHTHKCLEEVFSSHPASSPLPTYKAVGRYSLFTRIGSHPFRTPLQVQLVPRPEPPPTAPSGGPGRPFSRLPCKNDLSCSP